jgi:septum site-determining protein MinC
MSERESAQLQIKGIREGLLINLSGAEWSELEAALLKQIAGQPAFFQGARLVLEMGSLDLRVAELSRLRDRLSELGLSLWAVLSESEVTVATAQNLGLATRIAHSSSEEHAPAPEHPAEGEARWIKGPLRSGARVVFEGNVTILGDVNPGAEVVAGGSVVVWGRLRGVVHAGAEGDEAAVVCALDLSPTQLRIAHEIAVSPKKGGRVQPELARLVDGKLVAETWKVD